MSEKLERRGRPAEMPIEPKDKWELVTYEVPTKPELGYKITYFFDKSKTANGPYRTEIVYPKGYKHDDFKPEKGKAYNKQPVVMVFKTSNRSNAKTKMKVWVNENVDYIISAKSLPGVPNTAEVLELGVGESFIEAWKSKYSL
jgi:hypothetical protein